MGQAGIQTGNGCWELYCLEHGIQVRSGGGRRSEAVDDCPFDTHTHLKLH
jgi:hypothetical protein